MAEWRGGTKRLGDGSGRRQPVISPKVAHEHLTGLSFLHGWGLHLTTTTHRSNLSLGLFFHNHQKIGRKYRAGHMYLIVLSLFGKQVVIKESRGFRTKRGGP